MQPMHRDPSGIASIGFSPFALAAIIAEMSSMVQVQLSSAFGSHGANIPEPCAMPKIIAMPARASSVGVQLPPAQTQELGS